MIVKWNGKNKDWYENRGYIFTKNNTLFEVNVTDLITTSRNEVVFFCDYCGEEFTKRWGNYNKTKNKGNLIKDACEKCRGKNITAMKMKYTYEDMIKIFKEHNFEPLISKEEYIKANQLIKYRCKICGHEGKVSLSSCIFGRGCKKCAMKVLIDNQRYNYEYVKNTFEENSCELLSKTYENNHTLLDYVCDCGNKSKITFKNFLAGHRCSKCAIQKIADGERLDYDYIKGVFEELGCELLEDIYYTVNTKMKYKCSCGNTDYKDFNHFIRGQRCPKCAMRDRKESLKLDYDIVKLRFEELGYELLSEDYVNASTPLKYRCKCGEIAYSTLNNITKISGCPNCASKSRGEDKIVNYLINNNIKYERQYSFNNCKYKNTLAFDFAIFIENNLICLIEYQGIQHYEPVERFGGIKTFKIQLERDKAKNIFCINNYIPLIKIPYWEFSNLEIYLERQLNNILVQRLRNQLLFYLVEKEVS